MPIAVGETFERYEIESLIGRGGMGEVYRAVDTRLRRKVALKVLRPDRDNEDAVARLFREARSAAVLAHPNTVAIHDIGESEGIFYIVMELVTGSSLLAYVGDDRVPPARKLGWLVDVARALSAAHKAGVIHRDVKPSNVMVSDDGVVKVLDFGLAKPLAPVSFRTQQGHVLGTPRYMAPEQLAGADVDSRSDQYAFGLTAYELVAGKHPGGAISGPEPAPPLNEVVPQVSRDVAAVIARTMATLPDDRFVSMDDVAVALEDAIAGRPRRDQGPAAGPREPSEITAVEVAVAVRPLSDTMPLGNAPVTSFTQAVTTKRAGGAGAAVVAKMDHVSTAAESTGAPKTAAPIVAADAEEEVPTATARTTANVTTAILGTSPPPDLSPRATTLSKPEDLHKVMAAPGGMAGPNGTMLDPGAIARASARPPDRSQTLMSRDLAPSPPEPANHTTTLVTPGNAPSAEIFAPVRRSGRPAKPEAEAAEAKTAEAKTAEAAPRAKPGSAAAARAQADARATTGSSRHSASKAAPPKKTSTLAIALIVLGACAFAGAYYGSKELSRPQSEPVAASIASPPPSAAAAAAPAPVTSASSSAAFLPLTERPAEMPTASSSASPPVPTARPPMRPRPTATTTSSPLDMKLR